MLESQRSKLGVQARMHNVHALKCVHLVYKLSTLLLLSSGLRYLGLQWWAPFLDSRTFGLYCKP